MLRPLAAVLATLALASPAQAECPDAGTFASQGEIRTKGGGTYSYGQTVGDETVIRGTLTGAHIGLAEVSFDLQAGYHIGFGGPGLTRRLAPEASAAEPEGTLLSVAFTPTSELPEPIPGQGWTGTFAATAFAQGPQDQNRRPIAEATLDGMYVFLDEIIADFPGCPQRVQPVELVLILQGEPVLKHRVLYFPDLGVSAITRWGPDADGPLRKTGITGIGPAD